MADTDPTLPLEASSSAKNKTVAELRAEAKAKGIHGYSGLKKAELIAAIAAADATPVPAETATKATETAAQATAPKAEAPRPAPAPAEPTPASKPAAQTDAVAKADAARDLFAQARRTAPTQLPGDRLSPGLVGVLAAAVFAVVFFLLRRRRRTSDED